MMRRYDSHHFENKGTCRCDDGNIMPFAIYAENTTNNELRDDSKVENSSNAEASKDIFEKPQVDNMEMAIFLERILCLFENTMKKLEIGAALPIILADPELSAGITSITGTKMVPKAFGNHDRGTSKSWDKSLLVYPGERSGKDSRWSLDESVSSSESACSTDHFTDSRRRIYQVVQILSANHSAIRGQLKATQRTRIAPQCELFLQYIKYYVDHCVLRLKLTPVQEKIRELHFRKIWHENHRAQQDIDALVTFLEAQRSSHNDVIKAIDSQRRKDYETVERVNGKFTEDIKLTVNHLEKKQIVEHKNSESRQNDSSRYLAVFENQVNVDRDTNLRLEQEIRSKRFKVSSQLVGQIGKFDTEMGERYRFLEQLMEELNTMRMKKEKLHQDMKSQLEECNVFLQKIEEKNVATYQKRVNEFKGRRAARTIQRWWRWILTRLKLQKKKKIKKRRTKDRRS